MVLTKAIAAEALTYHELIVCPFPIPEALQIAGRRH